MHGFMAFTLIAAQELGIPIVMLFIIPACSLMATMQLRSLKGKGLTPLKVVDWIPSMRDIHLRDLPIYVRTTNPNDVIFKFAIDAVDSAPKASGVVILTFDALDQDVLDALSPMFPRIHAIGPLQLLLNYLPNDRLKLIGYNLWKEETECLHWLNTKAPNSWFM
ncbi:7-deoxyloganetin glucosyltransferase-like [Corylus avellana]|uniref:7-deoxyloganetin glucosyltransferase-like n=1 Tax=Corylus avellana TaxID=13451 RepID=UPI001E211F38|nr:7-deoxyloganetin glucosyltransferase-like [Corylus avellana]